MTDWAEWADVLHHRPDEHWSARDIGDGRFALIVDLTKYERQPDGRWVCESDGEVLDLAVGLHSAIDLFLEQGGVQR